MKKQIQLLENIFNNSNIFDDEQNFLVDVADQIYSYKIGDIYYENKSPYAICCGEKNDFQDKNPRFMLIKKEFKNKYWNNNYLTTTYKKINKFSKFDFIKKTGNLDYFFIYQYDKSSCYQIDENGYENTQLIKKYYNLVEFPAFGCCMINDNVYLPAIDELQIMWIYKGKINLILRDIKNAKTFDLLSDYWSSTQYSISRAFYLAMSDSSINITMKCNSGYIRPFLKL